MHSLLFIFLSLFFFLYNQRIPDRNGPQFRTSGGGRRSRGGGGGSGGGGGAGSGGSSSSSGSGGGGGCGRRRWRRREAGDNLTLAEDLFSKHKVTKE